VNELIRNVMNFKKAAEIKNAKMAPKNKAKILSSEKPWVEANMVRLHPRAGGKRMTLNEQDFNGVSCDIFSQLDKYDASTIRRITRKINLTIQVNPNLCSPLQLFRELAVLGPDAQELLQPTAKCRYHGDYESGLRASERLLNVLPDIYLKNRFGTYRYTYDSIGIAAAENFGQINHRKTSHFEIKFRRYHEDGLGPFEGEFLVLNVHLSANTASNFGKQEALNRLRNCIRLFYELVRRNESDILAVALHVDLQNFGAIGYSVCCPTDIDEVVVAENDKERNLSADPSERVCMLCLCMQYHFIALLEGSYMG